MCKKLKNISNLSRSKYFFVFIRDIYVTCVRYKTYAYSKTYFRCIMGVFARHGVKTLFRKRYRNTSNTKMTKLLCSNCFYISSYLFRYAYFFFFMLSLCLKLHYCRFENPPICLCSYSKFLKK